MLGDCWHRFYVRMLEVMQSIDLVRQAIDRYSAATGPVGEPVKLTEKLPKGEAYLETEAPQGQMGFMVVGGRLGDSLAGPRPQQQLLQSFGDRRALPRLPDRRRAGDRRLAGHRDGRDGSVGPARWDRQDKEDIRRRFRASFGVEGGNTSRQTINRRAR